MSGDIGETIIVYEDCSLEKEAYRGRLVMLVTDGFLIKKADGVYKVVYPTVCRGEREFNKLNYI